MLTEKELDTICMMLKAAMVLAYDKGRDEVHAHERRNIDQFAITAARRLSIRNKLLNTRKGR